MSKERPIPFSAPMVRAVLDGSKTQTRRVAKLTCGGHVKEPRGHRRWHPADPEAKLACPYGQPGDRLWVREAFRVSSHFDSSPPRNIPPGAEVWHEATSTAKEWRSNVGKLRPGMFMPHWASRILLEVTSVRVERLQSISEADAIAEGISRSEEYPPCWKRGKLHGDQNTISITGFPVLAYRSIWEEINGHESWTANPWVWVVEFKRIEVGAA